MAKASSLADNLAKELECAVCLEQYKEPKVLPCLHSFCKTCLVGLLPKQTKKDVRTRHKRRSLFPREVTINCPSCRQSVEIPQGKVDSLPVNFFLNNLLSMVALHEDSDRSNLECDNCDSGDPPVNRCTTCCHFLCEFCTQAHLRARGTSTHGMVSVEEAKKMGSLVVAKPSICKDHKGEMTKLFCVTCEKAICRDCTVVEHREHKYTFVKEAYSTRRESLLTVLSETKTRAPVLEEALQSVSDMKTRVQCHAEQTVQEVTKCCDDLTSCVNIRRERLIHMTEELKKVKLKALQIQQEELEMALGSVQNSVDFTEKALKNGSEVEVLNIHKQMCSRLEGFNSAKWQVKPCTDDVVKLMVDVNQLRQVTKTFGAISDVVASADMSTVTMEDGMEGTMSSTLYGEQITFTIIAKEQNGKRRRDGGDIFEAEICHGHSATGTEWLNIKDGKDGTYTFCYTPQQTGQYDLSVKLSNCHLKGSPFKFPADKLITRYGASRLTMGNGKEGVLYDTLWGQSVEFTIDTKEQKHMKKLSSRHEMFVVEIQLSRDLHSRNQNYLRPPERLAVKDKGNGRYHFCYTPPVPGHFHLSIKVAGIHVQGSPFAWDVEKWDLTLMQPNLFVSWKSLLNVVDENMRVQYYQAISFGAPRELSALGSVPFWKGKHSWKVKLSMGGTSEGFGVGVVRCLREVDAIKNGRVQPLREYKTQWIWSSDSKCLRKTGHQINEVQRSPTTNAYFGNSDVIELYLDCDDETLMMYNQRTKRSDTWQWQGERGEVSPVFQLCTNGDEVSLRL